MTDRAYQQTAVSKVGEWLQGTSPALFMVSPTGTGKTVMQCQVLRQYPGGLQTAPTEEILDGFRAHGAPEDTLWTIKKLKNRLAEGVLDPSQFRYWQCDEGHHSTDDTHMEVDAFLASIRRVGWSATYFRGTPNETKKLHDWYGGNVYQCITIKDAIAQGYMALPTFTVHPLVNDETVAVTSGEFSVNKVTAATKEKLEDLVHLIGRKYQDMGTMVSLTSVALVERFVELCVKHGIPVASVTGATPTTDRAQAFTDVQERRRLLVQIAVVSEGVNLPGLRRLIDARPTMSPLFWMQMVGRVTRPGEIPPEVWVCNHNLLRHGYLFDGLIPRGVFSKAATVWGSDYKPTKRMVSRAAGLDGLGAFKPTQVFTKAGGFVWFFALGHRTTEYCMILAPEDAKPKLIAQRSFAQQDGLRQYDKRPQWVLIDSIPDLTGCTSVPAGALSEPQLKWWKQSAEAKGLDVSQELNNRVFQILPVLCNTNRRLR